MVTLALIQGLTLIVLATTQWLTLWQISRLRARILVLESLASPLVVRDRPVKETEWLPPNVDPDKTVIVHRHTDIKR